MLILSEGKWELGFWEETFPTSEGWQATPCCRRALAAAVCRMQEKASVTFLSKIEQGLPFLSKLLPGRSRPLPSASPSSCSVHVNPRLSPAGGSSLALPCASGLCSPDTPGGAGPTSPAAGFPHRPKKFKVTPGKSGDATIYLNNGALPCTAALSRALSQPSGRLSRAYGGRGAIAEILGETPDPCMSSA